MNLPPIPPRRPTVGTLVAVMSAIADSVGAEEQAMVGADVERLQRAARDSGYRYEGDGEDVRCVPIAAQTPDQADAAKVRAIEKRKRKAAKRLAEKARRGR